VIMWLALKIIYPLTALPGITHPVRSMSFLSAAYSSSLSGGITCDCSMIMPHLDLRLVHRGV
jgi:hypothetical protein